MSCKSMIQIAQNFGRNAAAVGIETSEDAQELMGLGCDIGQGFLFGKPMTDRQLMTMVMAGRAESRRTFAVRTPGTFLPGPADTLGLVAGLAHPTQGDLAEELRDMASDSAQNQFSIRLLHVA